MVSFLFKTIFTHNLMGFLVALLLYVSNLSLHKILNKEVYFKFIVCYENLYEVIVLFEK